MKRRVVNAKGGKVVTREVELTPDEESAFEATRNQPPPLPEDTPTRIDDLERALVAKGQLTAADIAEAKRNR